MHLVFIIPSDNISVSNLSVFPPHIAVIFLFNLPVSPFATLQKPEQPIDFKREFRTSSMSNCNPIPAKLALS